MGRSVPSAGQVSRAQPAAPRLQTHNTLLFPTLSFFNDVAGMFDDHGTAGWKVLHTKGKLARVKAPKGAEVFAPCSVDARAELTLPFHRMLGHPDAIQGDMTRRIVYASAAADIDVERADLEAEAREWRLLLQIDSDSAAKMMWGDLGRVFFWIRADALAADRFDDVRVEMLSIVPIGRGRFGPCLAFPALAIAAIVVDEGTQALFARISIAGAVLCRRLQCERNFA